MSTVRHWNVQQHQESQPDGTVAWGPAHRSPDRFVTAAEAFAGLWARRKNANRIRIPVGLEFDEWEPGTSPRRKERVQVTFETPEGVAFDV